MQNQFNHVFNNRICMALLVLTIVGLISFSSVSSVFAPIDGGCQGSGCPQKQNMQKNSISSANQTTLGSTANNITSLTNSSQLSNR
jgi:hypothetical protein